MFTDRDGETDVGAVVVFTIAMTAVLGVVNLSALALVTVIKSPAHATDLQALGVGIGAILGGLAGMLASYAGYVAADGNNKKNNAMAARMCADPAKEPAA